jgi:hypothetical protein
MCSSPIPLPARRLIEKRALCYREDVCICLIHLRFFGGSNPSEVCSNCLNEQIHLKFTSEFNFDQSKPEKRTKSIAKLETKYLGRIKRHHAQVKTTRLSSTPYYNPINTSLYFTSTMDTTKAQRKAPTKVVQ